MKKASFFQDLQRGKAAESQFLNTHGANLEATDGRKGDFRIKGTEVIIELKSDFYDMSRYGNLIMEKWSRANVDGGPFQSLKHGCRYFIYYFPLNDKFFLFETIRLVKRLQMLERKGKIELEDKANSGFNNDYITQFFRVPITALEDLALHYETIIAREQRKAKGAKK